MNIKNLLENEVINKNIEDISIHNLLLSLIKENILIQLEDQNNLNELEECNEIEVKKFEKEIILKIKKENNTNYIFKIRYNKDSISLSIDIVLNDDKNLLKSEINLTTIYKNKKIEEIELFVDIFKIGVNNDYKNYSSLLTYWNSYSFSKNKKNEEFEKKTSIENPHVYFDIIKEIIDKKTISKDFFEILALNYDYKEKNVENIILKIFTEKNIIKETENLMKKLKKTTFTNKKIKCDIIK